MLAEETNHITESRAAELLGLNLEKYREKKWEAVEAVEHFISTLPSPLTSLLEVMRDQPELLTPSDSSSNSSGGETKSTGA